MVPDTTKQLSNSWWITMNHHLLVFMIFPNMNPFLLHFFANLPAFGHKSQINRSLRAARCLSFGSCCWDRLEEQLLGIASTLGSWARHLWRLRSKSPQQNRWLHVGCFCFLNIGTWLKYVGWTMLSMLVELNMMDWTMLVEREALWPKWTQHDWTVGIVEKSKLVRGGKTMPVLLVNNVVNPISKHPQIYLKWLVLQSSKNRRNMLGFTTITYINEHVQIPFAPAATSSWLIHSPWVNFASARHSVDFPLPCKPRTKTAVSVSSSLSAAIALGNATCARARARASPQSDDH